LKNQLKGIYESGPGSKASATSSVTSTEKLDSYEVSVNKNKLGDVKKQLELQNLFVKPLPQVVQQSRRQVQRNKQGKPISRESSAEERQRLEEQRNLSIKIGQELLERSQPGLKFDLADKRKPIKFSENGGGDDHQVPRTCYSLENGDANPCKDVHDEDDDFLLVLTDADSDEHQDKEVKSIVENWASGDEGGKSSRRRRHFSAGTGNKKRAESAGSNSSATTANTVVQNGFKRREDVTEQPKSFEEIKKSFENVNGLSKSEEDLKHMVDDIPPHLSVKTIRKSFEKINDQESLEATTLPRTPARSSSFYRAQYISKRTKSPANDPRPRKAFSPTRIRSTDRQRAFAKLERSLSNPDFSDTEGTSNSKKNFPPWHQGGRYYTSPRPNNNSSFIQLIDAAPNTTKYSRAYLSLVKNGDVHNKRSKFEDVPQRASIPARIAAKLHRMPDFSPEFVSKHMTDNTRVVIKTKEIADTNTIRRKLEEKGGYHQQQPLQQQQQQQQSHEMTGSSFNLHSKEKLKHLCKKIGHSKILGKMVALQCASNTEVDEGTTKLWNKASNEEEYLNVYRAGQVESKVQRFETDGPQSEATSNELPQWAGKGGKYSFSWSNRFGAHLPVPAESYTNAQKHNQFRKYYGYHPADQATSPTRRGDVFQRGFQYHQSDEPLSLPTELGFSTEGPPRPPERKYLTISSYFDKRQPNENKTEEPVYGKILPKSQRNVSDDGMAAESFSLKGAKK
jgi:hypothetical protein